MYLKIGPKRSNLWLSLQVHFYWGWYGAPAWWWRLRDRHKARAMRRLEPAKARQHASENPASES